MLRDLQGSFTITLTGSGMMARPQSYLAAFACSGKAHLPPNQVRLSCRHPYRAPPRASVRPPTARADLLARAFPAGVAIAGLCVGIGWLLASMRHRKVIRSLRCIIDKMDMATDGQIATLTRNHSATPSAAHVDDLLLALLPRYDKS